jgi:hypothetical protein
MTQRFPRLKLQVSPLTASPFWQTPQKEPKGLAPAIRVSLRSTSLTPSLLQGPAAKGHPWPIAALAASMPLNPLHNDSVWPSEGGGALSASQVRELQHCHISVALINHILRDELVRVWVELINVIVFDVKCLVDEFSNDVGLNVVILIVEGDSVNMQLFVVI